MVGGMIYFVQSGCAKGRIKIGHTVNILERLGDLAGASPYDLTVLTVIEGGPKEEMELHLKFLHLRIRKEWFKPSPDLLSFIKRQKPCEGWKHPRPLDRELADRQLLNRARKIRKQELGSVNQRESRPEAANSLINMVGAAGIEPATPTMSTNHAR